MKTSKKGVSNGKASSDLNRGRLDLKFYIQVSKVEDET
jgi:hypothetical protein